MKTTDDDQRPSQVVVGSGRRFGVRRKTYLLLGLVIGLACACWAVYYTVNRKPASNVTQQQTRQKTPQDKASELRAAVNKANATGDFGKSVTLLEAQADQTPETKLLLAMAYANNKQNDKSLAVLSEIDNAGQLSANGAMTAAEIAEHIGNFQLAIDYYTKAKLRLESEGGSAAAREIKRCDAMIAKLKAKV